MSSNDEDALRTKSELSDDDLAKGMSSTRVSAIKDEAGSSAPNSPIPDHNSKESQSSSNSFSQSKSTRIKDEVSGSNGHSSSREASRPAKSGRSATQKVPSRIAPLFDYLPDSTEEADKSYTVIESCTYQNKFLGYTEHAMECDCSEEWDSATKTNHACGEDSDCINRATKMECVGDCACGSACQNQRFGRRMYADVSVIKTEKKGYGLRTNVDLRGGDFIFEYIGEVIAEAAFRRRMVQYDEEGIKHFYFMSLSKGEFVDATRKGNMGRFCNHSCNPNCYVDKWVVGDKLRMGIFAERRIKAGEELVFNYNVDRYGANPQPCYCGESNCTGFIGGKTQTERATKLSAATIEALGIEDDFDSWDTAVAKKPRKKKTSEDDEDYVDSIEAKSLDADGVTKVMAALMQCKEKWIAVKLLQRIQRSQDEDVRHRIVKLHGYQIMNSQLSAWRDDENVVSQILDILDSFPRLTRNKIVDAKIDKTLEPLTHHVDERVSSRAQSLLDSWSRLELAYRIPRKVRHSSGVPNKTEGLKFERRETVQQRKRSRSRSRSKSPPKGPASVSVPAGPKSLQRPVPPPFRRGPPPLPRGWNQATDQKTGRTYFFTIDNKKTQWVRPTLPADHVPPPPPPKQPSQQDIINSIIEDIVGPKESEQSLKPTASNTPEPSKTERKSEKWRSYDEEKQKKLYENTLFPYISHVMSRYKHKIPKDDLKRFGKEIAKKLVNSDYKADRVKDPTKIDEKQQKKVKSFCKDYFEKAAQKHKKHEAERSARKPKHESAITTAAASGTPSNSPAIMAAISPKATDSDDGDIQMSDNEIEGKDEADDTPSTNGTLKRKRPGLDINVGQGDEADFMRSPAKKLNFQSPEAVSPMPTPPPPPPAPPAETPPDVGTPIQEYEGESQELDTNLHADTNFRSKSMADVLAQAQQEGDEEEMDIDQTDKTTRFEDAVGEEEGVQLDNPVVDGQEIVERIKEVRTA